MDPTTTTVSVTTLWAAIVATVTACVAVFSFVLKHYININKERVDNLQDRLKQADGSQEVATALGELKKSVASLQRDLHLLKAAGTLDPLTGASHSGGNRMKTDISRAYSEAMELLKESKFDLALEKAECLLSFAPHVSGGMYLRFLVNRAKGYDREALHDAEAVIAALPNDLRILPAYVFLIDHLLENGHRARAEKLALHTLEVWPESEVPIKGFRSEFGYLPSVTRPTEGKSR